MLYLIIIELISYIFNITYNSYPNLTLILNPFDTYEFRINHTICTEFYNWESRHVFVDVSAGKKSYGPFNSRNKISSIIFHKNNYTLKVSNEGPNIESIQFCFLNKMLDYMNYDAYPFKYTGVQKNAWQTGVYIMIAIIGFLSMIFFFYYTCCS